MYRSANTGAAVQSCGGDTLDTHISLFSDVSFGLFHICPAADLSGRSVAPVRIPSKGQEVHQPPTGGTPMSTPPSAVGMAAQLPFVDGGPEGDCSWSRNQSC